jgi:nickel/cobalt exporter
VPDSVTSASARAALLRSPFLWIGVLLLLALVGALVFSDGVAELARYSAEYQRRIQQALSSSLRDIQSGSGSLALWTLASVCFGYGVVHTLGPGHGKAVVVAYFLDSTRPRAWIEGIFAGAWIAFTHTLAALLLAGVLKLFYSVGLLGALREVRNVEIVSYVLILLVGFWRLWAGITGRLHEHPHGGGHDHDHAHHGHDHHDHGHHDHAHNDEAPRRTIAGWLLLTAAGIAPCAGALVVILLSVALGVLWAGVIGVIAIALGMAITLAAIGMASMVAHRLIIGDGRSQEIGRFTSIAASLIVIATAGTLLLGTLERFFR